MLLYEMFAIGIAVVLVVAAIGGLAARVMMGPEETALSRLARASEVRSSARARDWSVPYRRTASCSSSQS